MANSDAQWVNQRLAMAKWLLQEAEKMVAPAMAQGLAESALQQLQHALSSWISELAQQHKLSGDYYGQLDALVAELKTLDKLSQDIQSLQEVAHQEDSWLAQLLVFRPRNELVLGRGKAMIQTDARQYDPLTLGQQAYDSIKSMVERFRETMVEW